MKKIYSFCILLILLGFGVKSQTVTVYGENFGGAGTTTFPAGWTSATGDWVIDPNVNNGGGVPECALPLSSGNSVLAGSDGGSGSEHAITQSFSTLGTTNLVVNYNCYRSVGAPAVLLEVSSNNITYTTVPGWTDVVADDAWHAVTQFTLPASMENLPTVFLRWSYTASGNGFFFAIDDINIIGNQSPVFYWNGSGALNLLTSWGNNTNGTGTQPSSFTANNQTFFMINGTAPSLTAPWIVGGSGTSVQVGHPTGTISVNFTIPSSNALTLSGGAKLTINNSSTLTLQNTTFPAASQVNILTNSTVDFAQSSAVSLWSTTFQNLIISGAQKNQSGNFTVNGILNLNGANLNMANSTLNNMTLNGTIVGSGQVLTGNSRLTIGGTGSFGTITFGVGATNRTVNQFTYNRPSGGDLTLGSNLTVTGNATINNGRLRLNGNILTLNGTSVTLHSSAASGDFSGSRASSILLGGGTSTSISGSLFMDQSSSATRALGDLTLNRTAGQTLSIGNSLEVWGSITPSVGTIATGGNVSIKADASNKGRVGIISANGDITGNMMVEAFAPGGTTGWNNITSNGVTGQGFSAWNDDFAITCANCPDGSTVGGTTFTSIYEYDETLSTLSYSDAPHYVELTNYNSTIDPLKGYWVYIGDGATSTNAIVIDVTGPVNKKNLGSMNVTVTGGAGPETGFNLLGNPYPSPISFTTALGANLANTDGVLYVWNPDLNGGQGDHATFASGSGISSPAVGSGGINNNIPLGQAFMIHASSPFVLSPTESWKTASNSQNALLRSSNVVVSNQQYFRLQLNGQNFNTETVIHMHANATMGTDKNLDAVAVFDEYMANPLARIYSSVSGVKYRINAIPSTVNTVTLSVSVNSPVNGAYSILPLDMNLMPVGACISLYDNVTATTHNLKSGAYNFNLNNDGTNRFVLSITINRTTPVSTLTQPICSKQNTGKLVIATSGSGNYTYTWKNESGNIVRTVNTTATSDTLYNVAEGSYYAEVAKPGACQSGEAAYTVIASTLKPNALFTASTNTVIINNANSVLLSDASANASTYFWDFGDNTSAATATVSHAYTQAGVYDVKLVVTNGACADSSSYTLPIVAMMSPIGITENVLNQNVNVYHNGEALVVNLNFGKVTPVKVKVSNVIGQQVGLIKQTSVEKETFVLEVPANEHLLFVSVETPDGKITKKIINNSGK